MERLRMERLRMQQLEAEEREEREEQEARRAQQEEAERLALVLAQSQALARERAERERAERERIQAQVPVLTDAERAQKLLDMTAPSSSGAHASNGVPVVRYSTRTKNDEIGGPMQQRQQAALEAEKNRRASQMAQEEEQRRLQDRLSAAENVDVLGGLTQVQHILVLLPVHLVDLPLTRLADLLLNYHTFVFVLVYQ